MCVYWYIGDIIFHENGVLWKEVSEIDLFFFHSFNKNCFWVSSMVPNNGRQGTGDMKRETVPFFKILKFHRANQSKYTFQSVLLGQSAVGSEWTASDSDWSLRRASQGLEQGLRTEAEVWRTNAINPGIWEGDKSACQAEEQQVCAVCTEVQAPVVSLGNSKCCLLWWSHGEEARFHRNQLALREGCSGRFITMEN